MLSRRVAIWLAVLALLAVQALGLLHRVTHSPQAVLGTATTVRGQLHHDSRNNAVGGGVALSRLAALFSSHGDGSAECRLYDQLGHGDASFAVPCVALPLIPAPFLLQISLGEAAARWAALFDARGPPSSR